MPRSWVLPTDVDRLQKKYIGKYCDGSCGGEGAFKKLLPDRVIMEKCECVRKFELEYSLLSAGIPSRYGDFSFEHLSQKFKEKNATQVEIIRRYILNISEMVDEGVGLYFCGGKGVAKTALSCLILRSAILQKRTGYMVPFSQLTSMIRLSIEDADVKDKLLWLRDEVEVIVIDEIDKDFNAADTSNYTGTYVNDFFRHIYDRKAAMIVTSNLDTTKLSGKQASNVIDRMNELIQIVLVGESHRTSTKAEEILLRGR